MLQRAERQFWGQAHTKQTKKESVIMGHLWFHTFHLPLCVTVINILLIQNTRTQGFTWANYSVCGGTRVSIPPGQIVLVPFLLTLTSSLTIYLLTVLFFFFSIQLGLKLFLNPIPLSNSLQTPFSHIDIPRPPDALLTLSPFLPNPGSCTISQWNRSSLSV